MSDVSRRIAKLSPEKRSILERMLLEKSGVAGEGRTIPRREAASPAATSFPQQRLWFLDQLEPGGCTYNEPSAVRLAGKLDVPALERALNEIVRRHEVLRTTFAGVDGRPLQIISPSLTVSLPVTDLTGTSPEGREAEARRLARETTREPFDLARGPLIRARLFRLGDEDHVLATVVHHIVFDGWSAGVFLTELSALYGAFTGGQPSPLAELPIQYADFAEWQQSEMQGEVFRKQLDYWVGKLAGAPVLELPADRPRPAVQTFGGTFHAFTLPRGLTDALKGLSRRAGATLYMTLLAAYDTLVYRYCGLTDIVVGSPIANRNRVELEGLLGFFVNTLAVRADLSGEPTFRELLGRVKKTALEAYEYQDVPFEKVVEGLRPERNLSHSPVVQVMFALQNAPTGQLLMPGLAASRFEIDPATAKFDITFMLYEMPEGMRATLGYNTDLFDAATIKRMAGHYRRLLEAIAADPERRISRLPLLSDAERRQVLFEWNNTIAQYPRDKCVHEVFEEAARVRPESVAVSCGDAAISYGELDRRSNKLGRYLRSCGVGADAPVGLCVERSADMVVGMLGILKAGGAYLPLEAAYPRERFAFLLEDAGAAVLLTQEKMLSQLPESSARLICIDRDWPAIEKESDDTVESGAKPENTAYIIYTSGSTGTPKGTVIPHRAVNRLVLNTNYIEITPADRVAQASNASFDAATFEVWGALLNGAQLVVIGRDTILSMTDFAQEIRRRGVTVLFLTTALFNLFAREASSALGAVDCVLFGGETADPRRVREALESARPKRLLHVYGPTESTTYATWHEVKEVPEGATSVPIGRPISNTSVYILGDRLEPVPVGIAGEICIGGDGLARGYLKRGELTAEKFVRNPFSADGSQRLYRTGDVGRYLPGGNIDFIGRRDGQVKIRGFRVEPGEVEAVLGGHPDVKETAVVCREDTPGEKRLVAYVAARGERALTTRDLRSFLERKLPEYMVPQFFVMLAALPLTPNGKVDRRALPAPDVARGDLGGRFVAPRTPVEEALSKIWARALGAQKVGVRDDFFELGGHSLLAVRVFSEIEKVFGRKIPLAALFEAPTIEKLAEVMGQGGRLEVFPPIVPIERRGTRTPFFCVATADAFVFADLARRLGPEQPFYGLHPQGLVRVDKPDIDIVDLASKYVAQVRKVRPKGPYLLGGTCAGGVVAYEMAQQLVRQGHEVPLVAMFDTPGPFHVYYRLWLFANRVGRFGEHMRTHARNLITLGSGKRLEYLSVRVDRLKRKLRGEAVPPDRPRGDTPVDRVYWMAFNGAYMSAMPRYRPRAYPGRLILFLAEDQAPWRFSHSRLKWRKLAQGGVELRLVPGSHSDMLYEPQVNVVADYLNDYFGRIA